MSAGLVGWAAAQNVSPGNAAQFIAAGNRPIAGERIRPMLLGNTTYLLVSGNTPGAAPAGSVIPTYWVDGRNSVMMLASGRGKIPKAWWIQGDRLCVNWKLTSEVTTCSNLFEIDGTIYGCDGTKDCAVMRLVPGNPEGL